MKILKIVSIILVCLFAYGISYAMQQTPNWENMRLSAEVNSQWDLELIATIDSDVNLSDWYSLGVDIGNETYRKFFQYNANTGMLEVMFDTGISARDGNVPYFLSIKDVHYNELYTWSGGLSLEWWNVTATSTWLAPVNQAEESSSTLSSNTTPSVNTSSNYIIGGEYNRTSVIPTNVSKPGVSTVVEPSEPAVITPTILEPIEAPQAETATPEVVPTVVTPEAPTIQAQGQGHTPKYNSRSEEPRSINGIGNSKSYKSWRAQK